MQQDFAALTDLAMRHAAGAFRRDTPVPRLGISRATEPNALTTNVYEPMTCLVLQGAKRAVIGEQVVDYDRAHYFVASLELPASARVMRASAEEPYLSLALRIDREAIAALIAELPETREAPAPGFAVSPVTPALVAAWLGLARLLDTPEDAPVLARARERELLYRLLQGPQGGTLRQIARADSRLARVRRVIEWIRGHYDQRLSTETLAAIAGMSVPSLHRHFKAATAMSPLQYQKTLRLHTARELLVTSHETSRAAYSVGYESVSQFSREYARMFGAPPSRDAGRWREAATV